MSATLRSKLLAGFVLVFMAGLVAGTLVGASQSRRHWMDFGHHESLAQRIRNRMQSRLNLTPEQVARTAPIFEKTARQLEAIRTDTSRRVRETFVAVDKELTPDLTPEQRAKLAALEAKYDPARKNRKAERKQEEPASP